MDTMPMNITLRLLPCLPVNGVPDVVEGEDDEHYDEGSHPAIRNLQLSTLHRCSGVQGGPAGRVDTYLPAKLGDLLARLQTSRLCLS